MSNAPFTREELNMNEQPSLSDVDNIEILPIKLQVMNSCRIGTGMNQEIENRIQFCSYVCRFSQLSLFGVFLLKAFQQSSANC